MKEFHRPLGLLLSLSLLSMQIPNSYGLEGTEGGFTQNSLVKRMSGPVYDSSVSPLRSETLSTEVTITLLSANENGTLGVDTITTEDGKITEEMLNAVTKDPVDGYEFDGWYITSSCEDAIDYDAVYMAGDNIYAGWKTVTTPSDPEPEPDVVVGYTISFEPENGDSPETLQTGEDGKLTSLPTEPTKEGYTLEGWFLDQTGGEAVEIRKSTAYDNDTTYYAQWIADPEGVYTITFEPENGDSSQVFKTADSGKLTSLPTEPTKEDYTFDGWFLDTTDGDAITITKSTVYESNVTYYAQWTEIPPLIFTITLVSGVYGSADTATLTTNDDGTITQAMLDAVKTTPVEGYQFKGWYTTTSGSSSVNLETIYQKDTSIYAQWEVEPSTTTYTVTFDSYGGSTIAKQVVNSGNYATTPGAPVRSNYIFGGWYTTSSFTTPWNFSSDAVTSDMTLYAKWTAHTSTTSSGTVIDSEFNSVSGATVALMQNGVTYYTTLTDSSGTYYFGYVNTGTYNLRVTSGDIVYTTAVEVSSTDVALGAVQIPSENISSVVSISSSSPVEVVKNLGTLANNLSETTSNLANMILDFKVTTSTSTSNKTTISAAKEENDVIISYFDMDVVETVTTTGFQTSSEKLTDLPIFLEIVLEIPVDYRDMESYSIYRIHNDKVDHITTTENSIGEKIVYSEDENKLTLYTKKFSSYALAYCDDVLASVNVATYLNGSPSTSNTIGTVEVSGDDIFSGETVTVTPKANYGFTLDAIFVTNAAGNSISVTKNTDGTYSYTQPLTGSKVNVYFNTTLGTNTGTTVTPQVSYFHDVSVDDSFCEAVNAVASLGLMVGTGTGSFSPYTAVTRGMIVTILYMHAGTGYTGEDSRFTDVSTMDYYYNAVLWAEKTGIVTGYTDNTFKPDQDISREELAVIFKSYCEKTNTTPYQLGSIETFGDKTLVSDWASEAVFYSINTAMLQTSYNRFYPQQYATRSEVAVGLMALLSL